MIYHRTMKRSLLFGLAIGTGLSLAACSWVPKGAPQFDAGIKDRGTASWYGGQFHGKQAADGTIYDMEGLTAAHRTFPLGSVVRVVNLENGKFVFVRITDRGPYVNGRILDLSHAAAVYLGMERGGLAPVQVDIVGERRPDALLSSDALTVLPRATILWLGSLAPGIDPPLIVSPCRLLRGDLWLQRRAWRVPAMLAADHTAHTEVAGLVLV
ncbi:MAG TPA: septal ring lytic transglycosylase RlpA family protein [Nitrospira sp.]|nr:septal ring lytic transglycosylase RlpA family protein [Nitrospira sp.]